jgi:ribosomal protein L40E
MDNSIGPLPKVRLGDWIGEGWNMFAAEWKVWVLNATVMFAAVVLPIIVFFFMFVILGPAAAQAGGGLPSIFLLLIFVIWIFVTVASLYLHCGMYHCAFKQIRGEPVSTSDLFSAGDKVFKVLGAGILIGIMSVIGFLLCVIPAFIVAGAFYFTIPLIIERDLGVTDAMRVSRDATRGDLLMFVLFAFLVALIAQAGSYVCYVGLLVTMPLQFTIAAVAFRDVFGIPGARSFSSKSSVPPQHYGAPPQGYSPRTAEYQSPPSFRSPASFQPASATPTMQPDDQSSQRHEPGSGEPEGGSNLNSAFSSEPSERQVGPLPTSLQQSSRTEPVSGRPTGHIVCPTCQAELPPTAKFCARCGRSLSA